MKIDTVTTEPTFTGPYGRAWQLDMTQHPSTVQSYMIERVDAHPAWHSYVMSCVHLRPMAGVPDPVLHQPNATHELMLYALNPQCSRQAMIDRAKVQVLTPANFVAQFVGYTDEQAVAEVDMCMRKLLDGSLNPDTDFRQQWVALYGDASFKPAFARTPQ